MADNKPDLSDLKARLGLTKPAAAPPAGASAPPGSSAPPSAGPPAAGPPAASGPPQAGPPSAGPPTAGPPATSGPPPSAGPPTGGPPVSARPKPKPQPQPAAPAYTGSAASTSIDLSTVGGPTLESGKTFSGPVIALAVIAFVVGAGFSWAAVSSYTANQLIDIREADGASLRDSVKPRVAAFEDIAKKINSLNPNEPNFEAAEALATDDFVVPGSALASVTIPLPGLAIDNVANYAADTAQLRTMLAEHKRYTTQVDKEEIEALMEENKAIAENAGFGVVIDPKNIAEKWDKDDYRPQMGKLVGFKRLIEESQKVEIAMLPGGELRQVDIKEFIPIDKAQVLKAGGQNALQRYSMRIRNLKYQVSKIEKYRESLVDSLEVAAGGASSGAAAAAPAEEASE